MAAAPSPDQIRDYLLRQMPEATRTSFEQAYFADDSLLDQVEAEEDRLVSDYVLGRLSQSDRQRFEGSLLDSPYYRQRVETTSRLRTRVASSFSQKIRTGGDARLFPEKTGTFVVFSLMATLLVASLLSALRLRSQLREALARPVALSPRPEPAAPVVLLLDAPAVAGPEIRAVRRPAGAALVLVVPGVDGRYRASIHGTDGRSVWESGPREPDPSGRAETIVLPPGQPRAGWVTLRLSSEATGVTLRSVLLDVTEPR